MQTDEHELVDADHGCGGARKLPASAIVLSCVERDTDVCLPASWERRRDPEEAEHGRCRKPARRVEGGGGCEHQRRLAARQDGKWRVASCDDDKDDQPASHACGRIRPFTGLSYLVHASLLFGVGDHGIMATQWLAPAVECVILVLRENG